MTTADYLGGCVRNNLKFISFEECKLPPRGVGNVSLAKNQLTLSLDKLSCKFLFRSWKARFANLDTVIFLSGIHSLEI